MRCPNCGFESEGRFCPNCGQNMNALEESAVQGEPAFAEERIPVSEELSGRPDEGFRHSDGAPPAPKKKSYKKMIIIIVVAVAAVLIAAIIAFAVIVRGFTDNAEDWGLDSDPVTTGEEVTAVDEDDSSGEITEVEEQGMELPGGSYVVGEDIAAGKYNFTYTTEMDEDDYWSSDYFFITRSGSEGTEETLGGTKFDERFGSVDYNSAKAGKKFYANLKKGDKLQVDSDYGTWTY